MPIAAQEPGARSDDARYVVVTPVRNEAAHVRRTIDSMLAQTVRPAHWVLVDDGSSDGTSDILAAAAAACQWVTVVRRSDRGKRRPGAGVVEAFYDGYDRVGDGAWEFLVKLDGDLSFGEDYFHRCFEYFRRDPRLGIGGGTVCVEREGRPVIESGRDPRFHVRGATKIYRRGCWEQIAPLARAPGWDTIDETRANMCGWTTRTFPDLFVLQHKFTGDADGAWRNWFKNGRGCYMAGYDPVFMLARCARRSAGTPPFVAAVALASGFCSGYLMRLPRASDPLLTKYLRQQQRRRLLRRTSIYR